MELAGPALAAYLAKHLSRLGEVTPFEPHALLVAACAAGEPRALSRVNDLVRREATHVARSMGLDSDAAHDLAQAVREKLLVPADGAATGTARLTEYAGVGRLERWLRVVTARCALTMRRHTLREVRDGMPLLEREAALDDPELYLVRQRYRGEFSVAFATALSHLPDRERALLQCKCVDGMTLDGVARLCRVARSTAARRLKLAREQVLADTRRELAARCHLRPSEVSSVLRLLRRDFDESIFEALARGLA